jgi:hypothetical protein
MKQDKKIIATFATAYNIKKKVSNKIRQCISTNTD